MGSHLATHSLLAGVGASHARTPSWQVSRHARVPSAGPHTADRQARSTSPFSSLHAARRRSGQRKCERWSQNRLSHVDIAHRSPSLWPPCQTRYGSVVQAMVSAGSPTVPWVSRVPMLTSSNASLPGRLARGCQRYPARCRADAPRRHNAGGWSVNARAPSAAPVTSDCTLRLPWTCLKNIPFDPLPASLFPPSLLHLFHLQRISQQLFSCHISPLTSYRHATYSALLRLPTRGRQCCS